MHTFFSVKSLSGFILSALLCSTLYSQTTNAAGLAPMTTFNPQKAMNMENYEPMPGDFYSLVLDYGGGKEPLEYKLVLQDDHVLELPYIGAYSVKGMTFSQLRSAIIKKIRQAIPIQFISFMLDSPAQFDVFIYGQVKNTGFMTVNSLTRLSDALTIAGGFQPAASARTVEISRGEKRTVHDLKLFETQGKIDENPFLKPGDRIHVSQKKQSVIINGAVPYPGVYEFMPNETLAAILQHAGGLSQTASPGGIGVLRLDENRNYNVVIGPIDPERFVLKPDDRITVKSSLENIDIVTIEGAVFGSPLKEDGISVPSQTVRFRIPYYPGITLLEALAKAGGPTPFADEGKAYLLRKSSGNRIPLPELMKAWETRDSSLDTPLEPGDYLVVPLKKLSVFVSGEVNGPGRFEYVEGYLVGDYLTVAGGIKEDRGNPDGIFLVDIFGKKTKAGTDTPVTPGTRIKVEKNGWTVTQETLGTLFVVTGWIGGIAAFVKTIIEFSEFIGPRLPKAGE